MPLAVTHVLASVILVGIYRDYVTKHRHYFTLHTIFVAGLFGLLPDIDIALRMAASAFNYGVPWLLQHGGLTHTPFFAALFLLPALYLWKNKKHKVAVYFFVAAFAIMLHITLDFVIGGGRFEGIMWLYPLSFQAWKLHILNYFSIPNIPEALDALLLLAWLWHEEIKHKISDFV